MSGTSSIGKPLTTNVARVSRAVSGREAVVDAPSKLNVRLKVEGRRSDGYHLLSMINCSTSLRDTLRVVITEEASIKVTVTPRHVIPAGGGENLVSKSYRAFWREFDYVEPPLGLSCDIQKNIPVGGGLGGGSADAGAILRHLEEVFGDALGEDLGLSHKDVRERVMQAALSCGADVPYAVVGGLCWVGGIGEQIVPLRGRSLLPSKALIVIPAKPVPTAVFYERFRREHPRVESHLDSLGREFILTGEDLRTLVENDFEPVARTMVPQIAEGLGLMRRAFPVGTALTGSGSVCFSLVPEGTEDVAATLASRLQGAGFQSYLCSLIFS